MSTRPQPGTRLILTDHTSLGKVEVDLEAFFEFSFWMAEELEELTAKWRPRAAPKDRNDDRRPPRRSTKPR